MFKKNYLPLLFSIFLTACGGGGSSSEEGNSTVASLSTKSATVGQEVTVLFNRISGSTVTVFWGDSSSSRVALTRGSVSASHVYSSEGTFNITLRVDDGQSSNVGTVTVSK